MKKHLVILIVVGSIAVSSSLAQFPPNVYTRPIPPGRDVLDRLNLVQDWHAQILTDGMKDGISTVQHLGNQIIVQTRRGDVISLDPATGLTQWRVEVGSPYHVTHEVGFNDQLILATGATRVYAFDRITGEPAWVSDLTATPSSPPSADADGFYICLSNGRLASYEFPVTERLSTAALSSNNRSRTPAVEVTKSVKKAPPADINDRNYTGLGADGSRSITGVSGITPGRAAMSPFVPTRAPQTNLAEIGKRTAVTRMDNRDTTRGNVKIEGPKLRWEHNTHRRIQERPLLSSKTVLVTSTDNYAVVVDKLNGMRAVELPVSGRLTAPPANYGEVAYGADLDGVVYAFDLEKKASVWTFSASNTSTIRKAPQPTDEDLYVMADLGGLIRLDRATGQEIWQSPEAYRYRAANKKYVYASDKAGRLLVLDRAHGRVLARLDSVAFPLPVTNTVTDRLFLASEDGSLICLHDKEYRTPLRNRAAEPKISQSAVIDSKLKRGNASDAKPTEEPKPEGTEKPAEPEKPIPAPKPNVPQPKAKAGDAMPKN